MKLFVAISFFASFMLLLLLPGMLFAQSGSAFGVRLETGNSRKIFEIIQGSPAEKAGFKKGDMVLTVNAQSTGGMENSAIITLLAAKEEATLEIERAGVKKRISMRKMPLVAFGSKCISGNCENGFGRIRLVNFNAYELEGNFKKGEPVGECSIYYPDGQLWYKGNTKHFLPDGDGKKYEKGADGKIFLAEKGKYKSGFLDFGSVYDHTGQELSYGSYMPDSSRRFIGGYMRIIYRGKPAFLRCDDMLSRDDNGKSECTGWATIRENDPYTGRPLSHQYHFPKSDSVRREWDYDNGVCHIINYSKGKPVADWYGARITRLSDYKVIATNVRYAAAYTEGSEIINHITSGDFRIGENFREVKGPSNGGDFLMCKELYAKAPDYKGSGNGNNTQGTNPGNSSKYDREVLAECNATITELRRKALDAYSYYKAAYEEEKGYSTNRKIYERLQKEIIAESESAIGIYKGRVPGEMMAQLIDIKDALRLNNLGMGIMKSMPFIRN